MILNPHSLKGKDRDEPLTLRQTGYSHCNLPAIVHTNMGATSPGILKNLGATSLAIYTQKLGCYVTSFTVPLPLAYAASEEGWWRE